MYIHEKFCIVQPVFWKIKNLVLISTVAASGERVHSFGTKDHRKKTSNLFDFFPLIYSIWIKRKIKQVKGPNHFAKTNSQPRANKLGHPSHSSPASAAPLLGNPRNAPGPRPLVAAAAGAPPRLVLPAGAAVPPLLQSPNPQDSLPLHLPLLQALLRLFPRRPPAASYTTLPLALPAPTAGAAAAADAAASVRAAPP